MRPVRRRRRLEQGPLLDLARASAVVVREGPAWTLLQGTDPATGAPVAIRRPRRGHREGAERLREAGDMAAELGAHPFLDTLVATTDGRGGRLLVTPWHAAPLIDGAPLTPAAVAERGVALARALSAVHAGGAVHGGIDTSSVMRTSSGAPVLAGLHHLRPERQSAGAVRVPSPLRPETPPEELLEARTEPPGDVYSLAAVLTHLLTGVAVHPRVEGEQDAALALRILRATRRRPPVRDGLRGRLSEVLDSCLAHDPASRPTSDRLAAMLSAVVAGARTREAPPGPASVQGVPQRSPDR